MKTKEEILTWLLTHAGVESEYNRNLIYNTLVRKIGIVFHKVESAEKILERYRDDSQFPQMNCVVFTKDQCIEAMEEYASQSQPTDEEIEKAFPTDLSTEPNGYKIIENRFKQIGAKALRDGKIETNH